MSAERLRGAWEQGKEWFHFCFETACGPLLCNVLLEQHRGRARGVVTVLLLGDRGRAYQVSTEDVAAEAGGSTLRVGSCLLRLGAGVHELCLELPEAKLHATLRARSAATTPSSTHYGDAVLHWSVTPECHVRGAIEIDGRRIELGPVAYLDHNWGTLRWGGSVAWEWAYARTGEHALVWMRMLRRQSRAVLGEALLLFHGGRSRGTWIGPQLETAREGWWQRAPLATTPPILRHVLPDRVCGVPARTIVRGASPGVELALCARSAARIVVPDESAQGVTVINEVECSATLRLGSHGPCHGSAIMEVVHGA